jgi:hypothetical protein
MVCVPDKSYEYTKKDIIAWSCDAIPDVQFLQVPAGFIEYLFVSKGFYRRWNPGELILPLEVPYHLSQSAVVTTITKGSAQKDIDQ